jgi:hypothetical protein
MINIPVSPRFSCSIFFVYSADVLKEREYNI